MIHTASPTLTSWLIIGPTTHQHHIHQNNHHHHFTTINITTTTTSSSPGSPFFTSLLSSPPSPSGQFTKCLHSTDSVAQVHNHAPLACRGEGGGCQKPVLGPLDQSAPTTKQTSLMTLVYCSSNPL